MSYVLYALVAISALIVTVVVAITDGENYNFGNLGSQQQSIWGGKNPTKAALLKRIVIISSAVFMISTLLLAVISATGK